MPDLIDRTRLASIAVLAGFAILALALVSHIAVTNAPLSLPGLAGKGQVLTVPSAGSETSGKPGPSSATPAVGAPPATGFVVPNAGSAAAGNDTNESTPADSGAPQGDQPRQVGITLGTAAPSQLGGAPQTPTTPTGGGSSGNGSSPAGNGSGQENGLPGTQPPGPSNDYGHSSPIPPVTTPPTGSQASGAAPPVSDPTTTASGSPTTTSSTSAGYAGGRFKFHSPGHFK